MANRTDVYNLAADVALETAINSMLAHVQAEGSEQYRLITRKEALGFLARRAMRKYVGNKTRRTEARTPGEAQT